jgi:hypothetical protein
MLSDGWEEEVKRTQVGAESCRVPPAGFSSHVILQAVNQAKECSLGKAHGMLWKWLVSPLENPSAPQSPSVSKVFSHISEACHNPGRWSEQSLSPFKAEESCSLGSWEFACGHITANSLNLGLDPVPQMLLFFY